MNVEPGDFIVCALDEVQLYERQKNGLSAAIGVHVYCNEMCLVVAVERSQLGREHDDVCILTPRGEIGWSLVLYFDAVNHA